MNKKILFSMFLIAGASVLVMSAPTAHALCASPQGCYFDIPPSILSMTATPSTVTTESSVSIDISGRRGGQYKDGVGFISDNDVSLTGTIKDSSGAQKKSFTGSFTSGGHDFTYNTSVDVSSWDNGVYTVYAQVCTVTDSADVCNDNTITFTIQRGTGSLCQTTDGIKVCISADPSWVYKGSTSDITWDATWVGLGDGPVDECHATEGPGFATGGSVSDTDTSDSLTTVGIQPFTVECTKTTFITPVKGEPIPTVHTASNYVNVEVLDHPNNPQPSIMFSPTTSL